MRSNALPLTEEQLALVRAAANAVPPRWRERYLVAVADLLTGQLRITNHELAALLGNTRRTMVLGVVAPVVAPDE
jgi:hypothetical protein